MITSVEVHMYHYCSEEELVDGRGHFKSIRKAAELAMKGKELDWYLAMTDSIIGSVMSADACTESEKEKLAKVE